MVPDRLDFAFIYFPRKSHGPMPAVNPIKPSLIFFFFRFYLGHWQEGIGKLFSFGGLGVWTLVDVLLIAIRYLGPADGSFYV